MKRYEPEITGQFGDPFADMLTTEDGSYVLYSEAQEEIQGLRELLLDAQTQIDQLRGEYGETPRDLEMQAKGLEDYTCHLHDPRTGVEWGELEPLQFAENLRDQAKQLRGE